MQAILIWIRLLYSDFSFWPKDVVKRIASVMGTPLFTDITAAKSRESYARACVEVKAGTPLLDEVPKAVQGRENVTMMVKVVYDWKPAMCTK